MKQILVFLSSEQSWYALPSTSKTSVPHFASGAAVISLPKTCRSIWQSSFLFCSLASHLDSLLLDHLWCSAERHLITTFPEPSHALTFQETKTRSDRWFISRWTMNGCMPYCLLIGSKNISSEEPTTKWSWMLPLPPFQLFTTFSTLFLTSKETDAIHLM